MNPLPLPRSPRALTLVALVLLAAVAATPVPAHAAPPPPAGPEGGFGEVSDVTLVEVPVQVVHQGRPVHGLGADDFRILDEGTPRAIASFEVIDLGTTSALADDPTPRAGSTVDPSGAVGSVHGAGRRHLLLLFDLAFTPPHDLDKAERAARELLDVGLHPSDLVGVALYSPRRGASLLVNFTTDRGQVRRVLDGLRVLLDGRDARPAEDGGAATERRDPLGLTAGAFDAVLADVGVAAGIETSLAEEAIRRGWLGPSDKLGGTYEYNKVSNMMWSAEQQIHDRRAGRVSDLARSLASLARHTAGIRGAKHLVLFSNGFDADLLQPKTEAGPRTATPGWWATGGGTWILDDVKAMIGELQASGWQVHAVELDGLDAHGRFSEGLFFVARDTGGALYENTNDVSKALGEVMEVTSVTYLLTFTADSLPADPAFRRLEVRVDGLPRGARVSHRAGYHAPRSFHALSAPERRAEAHELLFSGRDQDAIGARVLAVPRRAGGGAWRVPVVLELDGAGLLAGPGEREAGAEIYVYAFDRDGRIADFVAHRVAFTAAQTTGLLAGGGLKFLGELDLPGGGRYELRLLARSLRSGAAAVRGLPLSLPAGDDRRSVLLPPVVLEGAGGRWVVVNEIAPEAAAGRPFTFHGRELMPSAGTVAAASGEVRFLILGYGLSATDLRVEARLTTPAGEPLETAPASFLARAEAAGDEPELILAAVDTAALAPGSYALEVVLRDGRGEARGHAATPLLVRPRE